MTPDKRPQRPRSEASRSTDAPPIDPKTLDVTEEERAEIARLLARIPHNPPTLEEMWRLMDTVWEDLGCDNRVFDDDKYARFYRHPVWTLHGLFVEQHALSLDHRLSVAAFIASRTPPMATLLDFGGGFGTLARRIADQNPTLDIDILEPHASPLATVYSQSYKRISFVNTLRPQYDGIILMDVLEHVPTPLPLLCTLIERLAPTGCIIFGNHFYPAIKCHLPDTFHLRYSFRIFARMMGLRYRTRLSDTHIQIFEKTQTTPRPQADIARAERISKRLFPLLLQARTGMHRLDAALRDRAFGAPGAPASDPGETP